MRSAGLWEEVKGMKAIQGMKTLPLLSIVKSG